MTPIEQIISVIRSQGAHNNPSAVEVAKMKSNTSINYSGMTLTKSDYLKPSGLYLEKGDTVALVYNDDLKKFIILCKVVEP